MRFVLGEYLSSLKEDGELDSFLIELLRSMRYLPMSKIQKGRQYGVDLPAVGTDQEDGKRKLFLFVVKQGNFSRKNWDSGNVNDIRPSITEILDVYLTTRVPKPYDKLPVQIIVCCNGDIEPAVQVNWTQFVNNHTKDGIEFDFWGIHRLVDYAESYQMQEETLSSDLLVNFRRALSFIDLSDYNLSHFYKFLHDLLPSNEPVALSEKQVQKKLRLINLCMSIIHAWCKKSDNLKPSYIASERIVLSTFNWLVKNGHVEKKNIWTIYYSILQNWRVHNHEYIERTGEFYTIQDSLSIGITNHNEYCLITYEQMGIVAMMGLLEIWEWKLALSQPGPKAMERAQYSYANAEGYAHILAKLIENNPSSLHPRYDEHCIEINLALILFHELGLYTQAINWIKSIIDRMMLDVKMANFFPLFNSDPTKLETEKASNQESSLLANFLAEWCLVFRLIGYYRTLKGFLDREMPQLNNQLWIPDEEVDNYLYSDDASKKAGSTMVGIKLPDNYLILEMNMAEERAIFNYEKDFAFNKYYQLFMPFLSSRHFRTYPFPNSWRGFLRTRFCFNERETNKQ